MEELSRVHINQLVAIRIRNVVFTHFYFPPCIWVKFHSNYFSCLRSPLEYTNIHNAFIFIYMDFNVKLLSFCDLLVHLLCLKKMKYLFGVGRKFFLTFPHKFYSYLSVYSSVFVSSCYWSGSGNR